MSRFTDENKWDDSWFAQLKSNEKLLFMYLCDRCDIAGFLEYIPAKICLETGITQNGLELAFKGLDKSVRFNGDVVFVVNFVRHQKNFPLNPVNKCHLGIINRLEKRRNLFEEIPLLLDNNESYHEVDRSPCQGASKGLQSPSGIGIGNGIGKVEGIGNASKRFVPPTLEESKEYFAELGANGDMYRDFHEFYESKAWMVGKNKMQKWRSAASRWHRSNNVSGKDRIL